MQSRAPNVDISAVDVLGTAIPGVEPIRACQFKTTETVKSRYLALWRRPAGAGRHATRSIKGAQVSITVGLTAALVCHLHRHLAGCPGRLHRRLVDDVLEWVYNVFTAIPYILLIFALAAVLKAGPYAATLGNSVWTVVIILGLAGWTGIYRLVRAEYIKHRARDYVRAAEAIGASHLSRMFTHILPNISHVVLVQLSLHVVGFIKAEVILSFLGLGVPIDMVQLGHDVVRITSGIGARQVVATGCRHGHDGHFCHRIRVIDRCPARCAGPQTSLNFFAGTLAKLCALNRLVMIGGTDLSSVPRLGKHDYID